VPPASSGASCIAASPLASRIAALIAPSGGASAGVALEPLHATKHTNTNSPVYFTDHIVGVRRLCVQV
jgi:hypothetical protein